MIYSMYWNGHKAAMVMHGFTTPTIERLIGQTINLQEELAHYIKQSKDDSFVFIVTRRGQYDAFHAWLDKYDMQEYVVFEPPTGVTNPNYADRWTYPASHDGNLKMIIMASKDHSLQDQFVYKKGTYGAK